MKYLYDCHTHCVEGSFDAKASIFKYIEKLKKKGFSGLIITDHNSYNDYRYYINNRSEHDDFYVIRGIEYDTASSGHFLIIMPDEYDNKLIETRGMKLEELVRHVHLNGGILGPAHPFQEPLISIFRYSKYKDNYDVLKEFDFVETFNIDDYEKDRAKASELANNYYLACFGGSDCHDESVCGLGYTEFDEKIKTANDLIKYVKAKKKTKAVGIYNKNSTRERIGILNKLIIFGYFFQNNYYNLVNRKKINLMLAKDK